MRAKGLGAVDDAMADNLLEAASEYKTLAKNAPVRGQTPDRQHCTFGSSSRCRSMRVEGHQLHISSI